MYAASKIQLALTKSYKSVISVEPQNFVCTIVQSQCVAFELASSGGDDDSRCPGATALVSELDRLNLAFVVLLVAELALSSFSRWSRPFLERCL